MGVADLTIVPDPPGRRGIFYYSRKEYNSSLLRRDI